MVAPIYRFVTVLVNLFASLQRGNLRQPPKLVPAHKKLFVRFRTTYAVLASNILLVLIPDVVASSLFLGQHDMSPRAVLSSGFLMGSAGWRC